MDEFDLLCVNNLIPTHAMMVFEDYTCSKINRLTYSYAL